jgi:predicted TPR repeat methyltransferase
VRAVATEAALQLDRLDPVSTRQNKGEPVPGLLGLARRER